VPLQVHYYSEALPTQHGYCVVVGDRTKWYWTKWYGQNVSNFYRFQFNWIEFVFSNHKSHI